jgi:nucleoside-diphosphate-sugar epimerase
MSETEPKSLSLLGMKIGIIGSGWLGKPLCERLTEQGHQTFCSSRQTLPCHHLEHCRWDGQSPIPDSLAKKIGSADALVVTVPPQRDMNDDGNKNFHENLAKKIALINEELLVVYTSSTSVYGPQQGDLLEKDADMTTRAYGIEKAYLRHFEKTCILRFGGLLGPERHPSRFFKPGQSIGQPFAWINMTHLSDAMGSIQHCIRMDSPGIFNVVSPGHCSRKAYYNWAFEAAKMTAPHFDNDDNTGKRVLSQKIMQLLHFQFEYSDALTALENTPVH